ncbi:helix-turn-helix transcriptional regulator [Streptomyces sp. NPDC003038]|uniref:helix-turn-helix domain-containing protein n=1 Tax=unclassified Streptomyces TaxID=2593676 RepID=UPI0033A59208
MRSMEPPKRETVAQRFGALIYELATKAGFDLTPGAGGRQELAEKSGMHKSSVGRMLDGQTLPSPAAISGLARAVGVDVMDLLIEAEIIPKEDRRKTVVADVLSATPQPQPLSPSAAADAWGITDPMIRGMLISNITQAIRLQQDADQQHRPDTASTGDP